MRYRTTARCWIGVAVLALVAGCASTNSPARLQTVRLSVVNELGAPIDKARCTLTNGAGEWSLEAPGATAVMAHATPLVARCTSADGRASGEATAQASGGRMQGALVGGVAGALVGGAVGEKDRKKNASSGNFGDEAFAPLSVVLGALVGALVGGVAGGMHGSGNLSYPDSLQVTLKPL